MNFSPLCTNVDLNLFTKSSTSLAVNLPGNILFIKRPNLIGFLAFSYGSASFSEPLFFNGDSFLIVLAPLCRFHISSPISGSLFNVSSKPSSSKTSENLSAKIFLVFLSGVLFIGDRLDVEIVYCFCGIIWEV